MRASVLSGGFSLNGNREGEKYYIINRDNWSGDKVFEVGVNNGTAWLSVFITAAYSEQGAIDSVVDFCEDNEFTGLVFDSYTLENMADAGMTADEYADENGLICAGNHGIYINVGYVSKLEQ